MFKKILVISCVLILQSCASSKGYIGEKRPSSELATIYKADIQKYGTVAKQWVHIQQINDFIVGTTSVRLKTQTNSIGYRFG
jgi:hypothetical protein